LVTWALLPVPTAKPIGFFISEKLYFYSEILVKIFLFHLCPEPKNNQNRYLTYGLYIVEFYIEVDFLQSFLGYIKR
jgi:hypothetical protein